MAISGPPRTVSWLDHKENSMSVEHPDKLDEISAEEVEKFLTMVSKVATSRGCLLWTGCVNSSGYGAVRINGGACYAHRVAYRVRCGSIDGSRLVMHACDVQRCCNPDHLSQGTAGDNIRDAAAKGRVRRGDNHPVRLDPRLVKRGSRHYKAVLTEATAAESLRMLENGDSPSAVAVTMGVAVTTIKDLKHGRTWKHVPRPGDVAGREPMLSRGE